MAIQVGVIWGNGIGPEIMEARVNLRMFFRYCMSRGIKV